MDWVSVLVAAACMFVVGGLWYGPFFGESWMQAVGLNEEDIKADKSGMAKIYGTTFVLQMITATVMDYLLAPTDLMHGAIVGAMAGAFLASTAMGINYLFEGRPRRLFYINAGFVVIAYGVMGAILGLI